MRLPFLRHLLSIAALPFMVTVVVPWWMVQRDATVLALGTTPLLQFLQIVGGTLLLAGLVLFAGSLRRFATEGDGTLAPWDPPRRLVVTGLYRYVRNPMITGVVTVLLGEAAVLLSPAIGRWAALVFLLNAIYIPLIEEPMLVARFGDPYRDYCRHVPRLVPRLRAWEPMGENPPA
jgi:protein-S-isoprenylcysteine O-methyltransferase Ste14